MTHKVHKTIYKKTTPTLSLAKKNNDSDAFNSSSVNDVDSLIKAINATSGNDTTSVDDGSLNNKTTEEGEIKSLNATVGIKNITNEIHNVSVSAGDDDSILKAAAKQTLLASPKTQTAVAVAPAPVPTSGEADSKEGKLAIGTKEPLEAKEPVDEKLAFNGKDPLQVKVNIDGKDILSPTIMPITTAPKTLASTTPIFTRKIKPSKVVSGPSYPTPKRPPFPPMSYNLPSTIIHYGPTLSPTINPGQDPSLPNLKVGPVEVIDERTASIDNPAIPNTLPIGPLGVKTHVIDFDRATLSDKIGGADSHISDSDGALIPSKSLILDDISPQSPERKKAVRKHHIKKLDAFKHSSLFSNPHPDNPSALLLPPLTHKKISRRTHIRTKSGDKRSFSKNKTKRNM